LPTTLLGVALFVFLLFPGYVYERRRLRDVPERVRSPFAETLSILFVGVVLDAVALFLLALTSPRLPAGAPDLHLLIDNPRGYASDHYQLLAWWAAAVLLLATGMGYLMAARPWDKLVRGRSRRRAARLRVADPQQSAWWLLFHEHPEGEKYVGCYLDDGSYVAGILHSYSRLSDESGDRDLTLRHTAEHPVICRPKGTGQPSPLADVAAAVVSARRIVMLTVTYLGAPAPAGAPGGPTAVAAAAGAAGAAADAGSVGPPKEPVA
jgi:Family of unknown function (DUF6338)